MEIRKATAKDFDALYTLGLETPEFKVSSNGVFMERDEFLSAIENPYGTFLLSEDDGEITGFVYANRKDVECGPKTKWACVVYIVVRPEYRKRGIAQALMDACLVDLKENGVNHVYCWASSEGDGGIIRFMENNGFQEGHAYVWMDKEM